MLGWASGMSEQRCFSHLGFRVWALDPRDRALQRYRLLHDMRTTVAEKLCPEVDEYWKLSWTLGFEDSSSSDLTAPVVI